MNSEGIIYFFATYVKSCQNGVMDLTRFVKAPKNKKERSLFVRKYYDGVIWLADIYSSVVGFFNAKSIRKTGWKELDEVRERALIRTNINDHLETLFLESTEVRPRLIVELGVGPGESTFVFERVAKICGAKFVSVDLRKEMEKASSWPDWIFVNENDVEFAQKFPSWTTERGMEPLIDVLFIDTSHKYDHTLREIELWFRYLSENAKVFFHDTNVRPIYRRKDGTIGLAYDIKRGVIRALETHFGKIFNEKKDFIDSRNGWLIKHHSSCNGLTILTRKQ